MPIPHFGLQGRHHAVFGASARFVAGYKRIWLKPAASRARSRRRGAGWHDLEQDAARYFGRHRRWGHGELDMRQS